MNELPKDKRAAQRRRVLKAARITFNERRSTVSCIVRDLSESGARLRIEGSPAVPDTFELLIEVDGTEIDCKVVRRKGEELAVTFMSTLRKVTPKRVQVIDPLIRKQTPSLRRKPSS